MPSAVVVGSVIGFIPPSASAQHTDPPHAPVQVQQRTAARPLASSLHCTSVPRPRLSPHASTVSTIGCSGACGGCGDGGGGMGGGGDGWGGEDGGASGGGGGGVHEVEVQIIVWS